MESLGGNFSVHMVGGGMTWGIDLPNLNLSDGVGASELARIGIKTHCSSIGWLISVPGTRTPLA